MKRTSIKDIAQIAQVSVATVSYVLNNKEGQKISEATKEKILKIAESINYKPNKIAKSLKTNKTKLLGLIVADISNEFYSTLARKLENKALKKGYTLIIGSSDENAEKFQMLIELFSQQQVDGLIIAPVAGSEVALNQLIKEEYPAVMIDRYINDTKIPAVLINNKEISEKATNRLLDKDFDTIVYIGYQTTMPHLLDREKGFDSAILNSEKSVKTEKILVGIENTSDEVKNGIKNLLDNKVSNTALFFSSNKLAVAGLKCLLINNIKVPEEVSVIAFDETEAYNLFPTEITYIKQPLEEMADETITILDHLITDYKSLEKTKILSTQIIEGKSIK